VTLGLTWSGPLSFAFLAGAVALILLWEWGHLTSGHGFTHAQIFAGVFLIAAAAVTVSGWFIAGFAAVIAGSAIAFLLSSDERRWVAAVGTLYAGLPAVALIWFRSDIRLGLESLVFLLVVVWATDIGAFLAGRVIGGPKLWTKVSPNKTWAGLLGGVTAAAVLGSAYVASLGGGTSARTIALAGFLAVVSQAGDLFESGLKRAHGVKDSSNLIPGHGGFMDRVDGLVFAAVVAAAYALLVDRGRPAAALLGLG